MSVRAAQHANTLAGARVTALAAIACAMVFITAFLFIVVVWPLYGVKNAADVGDPSKILPALAGHPLLMLFNVLDVPIAALLLVVARGLGAPSGGGAPAGLARAAGLVAAGCLLAVGTLRFLGYAQLAALYERDAAAAAGAYARFHAVQDTLDAVAILALGCWLALLRAGRPVANPSAVASPA
jgi:hypothetical protein